MAEVLENKLMASGRGDRTAFADLYDLLAPRIYGLTQRILGDGHQSEEITQEVLLNIWQNSNRYDPGRGSALSWAMTIAHRRAVDRVRAAEAGRRRDDAHAEPHRQDLSDQTYEAVSASLESQRVRGYLAKLSVAQRQALELAYFKGHTQAEVATLLEIPLGTAKTRIRDGLIQLRELMSADAT
jgi:RNA polymerase sigma-70 factor (ECF subfamily)